jgi:hypothetical protein
MVDDDRRLIFLPLVSSTSGIERHCKLGLSATSPLDLPFYRCVSCISRQGSRQRGPHCGIISVPDDFCSATCLGTCFDSLFLLLLLLWVIYIKWIPSNNYVDTLSITQLISLPLSALKTSLIFIIQPIQDGYSYSKSCLLQIRPRSCAPV